MTILTQEFVISAINSTEEFPIDFDDVWEKLGYSTKGNAKRRLVEDLELEYYHLLKTDNVVNRPQGGGSQPEAIKLSVDGFKHFCLMARTEQGREVRKYFIDIEKFYRQNLERQFAAPSVDVPALVAEVADLKERLAVYESQLCGDFTHDLDDVLETSGLRCKRGYLTAIVKGHFVRGIDYALFADLFPQVGNRDQHKFYLTEGTANNLLNVLRGTDGVDLTKLPKVMVFKTIKYFKSSEESGKNKRFPKSR